MRVLLSSICSALAILSFGISVFGQYESTSIKGPILGFVQDRSGATIRPILGVVGASVLGSPLELGYEIRNAVISPKQDFALAVRSENAEVMLIRFGSGSITVSSLDGVRSGADLIAVSPTGTAAAVYGDGSRILQSITGLAESPQVVFEFDTSDIAGRLQGMAIADDGTLALLNFTTEENATLWAVSSSGFRWLLPAQRPSAASFLANRRDAVIADDGAQEVFLVREIDQEGSRIPVASFGDGFDAISGVAASDDGLRVYITSKTSETVTLVDLDGRLSTALACHCLATGLYPLSGASLFRLSDSSDGPVALLDASSSEPRIIVLPAAVPATASSSEGGQEQ